MTGSLDILNVGSGHLTLTFGPDDPVEVDRTKRMITDMLRRGYAIFVEVEGVLRRAEEFDPVRGHYVVGDVPVKTTGSLQGTGEPSVVDRDQAGQATKTVKHRRVSMTSTRATAVGRSAGG